MLANASSREVFMVSVEVEGEGRRAALLRMPAWIRKPDKGGEYWVVNR